MAELIKEMKTKFEDIFSLLIRNQKGPNELMFFMPNKTKYTKEQLQDKLFYYSHIFQKCKYDNTLFINFFGKVLKSDDFKTFISYLGWTKEFKLNIKSVDNYLGDSVDENLRFYQTDGICIEESMDVQIISSESEKLPVKKCENPAEYLKYYDESFAKKSKKFQKAKTLLESFCYLMKNTYILVKGYEDSYSQVFQEKVKDLINIFRNIFKIETVAKEYIDSYVFNELYEDIMVKLNKYYFKEEQELKNKLEENKARYEIVELELDPILQDCKFKNAIELINNLKNCKTSYEKVNLMVEINTSLVEEARNQYKKVSRTDFDVQGDFMLKIWLYLLAHAKISNMLSEFIFLNFFRTDRSYDQRDYIINNFVVAVTHMKTELLQGAMVLNNIQSTQPIKVNWSS